MESVADKRRRLAQTFLSNVAKGSGVCDVNTVTPDTPSQRKALDGGKLDELTITAQLPTTSTYPTAETTISSVPDSPRTIKRRMQANQFLSSLCSTAEVTTTPADTGIQIPAISPISPMTDSSSSLVANMNGTGTEETISIQLLAKSPDLPRSSLKTLSINNNIHQKSTKHGIFVMQRIRENKSGTFDLMHQNARVFLTGPSGMPSVVFSVIRFQDSRKNRKRSTGGYVEKLGSIESLTKRKLAESFAHLLQPSIAGQYDPMELDDPELTTGKHKTVINLPSYMISIIQYARPSDLKRELNDQMKQQHPDLDPNLTLSKIRNLKAHLLQITLNEDLELSTLAKAYCYFEKLVFKQLVKKENRKLYASVCLLLAAKVNDKKDVQYLSLLCAIEKELGVPAKEIREHEFSVFVALEFSLHIPREEYLPHFERIAWELDYNNLQEYLDGKPPTNRPLAFV